MKTVQKKYEYLCNLADSFSPVGELMLDFRKAPLVAQHNFKRLNNEKYSEVNKLALELEPMFWDMKRLADMEATVKHEAQQRSMRIAYDNNPSINFNTLK
jgi:hypothetical protein